MGDVLVEAISVVLRHVNMTWLEPEVETINVSLPAAGAALMLEKIQ
jgi:hypothetical protein